MPIAAISVTEIWAFSSAERAARKLRLPNLFGVLFDPAVVRIVTLNRDRMNGHFPGITVE